MTRHTPRTRTPKPPIQPLGVLFAFAANLLFVNLADQAVRALTFDVTFESVATLLLPLAVGVATHFYVRARGGIHAFIGGMLSIPMLAFFPFDGNWQFAILAGAFCALGGALAEIITRSR